ncbi:MAG: ABC transporter ATP-binding protein, partial [bacterium]
MQVDLRKITKRFAHVLANDAVDLTVESGTIHALVGENGAGKSTLMRILYGLHSPDEGQILLNGKEQRFASPKDAIRAGIGMVHQHFMLIPPLTVAENMILGRETTRAGGLVLDLSRAIQEIEELSQRYGLLVKPKARVSQLSVGEEQRVEILKTLYRGADLLILDEPTAVLTPQEVRGLFKTLRRLKELGKTILLITHRLQEVKELSEELTVMRDGRKIGTRKTADTSLAEMARMMVGREVLLSVMRTPRKPGEPALSVRDLSLVGDRKRRSLHEITFDVRSGEVLGVAGVEGNGQTELIEIIAGLVPPSEGEIRLKGRPITTDSPARRLAEGLAHIPPDRRKQGLILSFSVRDNLVLGRHREKRFRGWLDLKHKEVRSFAHSCIEAQDIRPRDPHVQVSKLSGGNQQKVILARELSRGAAFIIAAHP